MGSHNRQKGDVKKKIREEFALYWINVVYLSLMFAAFTQYRRLILAAHDITYTHYWVAVVEALVLAKVILIGDALRLGRRLEHKPLIYSTILKTIAFSIFVGIFSIIERTVTALWKGDGLKEALLDFFARGTDELLAGCLVILVAFIPLFAYRELERVLGKGKIFNLFFRERTSEN
jgi:hypothetical protein